VSLATYIASDLEARIRAGEAVPLTRRGLAEAYSASVSPVNTAVDALCRDKLLIRCDDGRLTLPRRLPRRPRRTAQADAPHALRDAMRDQLVRWCLRGEPHQLREEALAEQFGVGRTALRGALGEFARQGLVEHVPRRGWNLRTFTEKDLSGFLSVRATLECMALDLARPRLGREDLQVFLAGNQPDQREEDNRLHAYIIERCDNRYIQDFFAAHGPFWETLFHWEGQHPDMLKQTQEQHRAILEAMLARRWRVARDALNHHILYNHDFLVQRVRRLRSA